MWLGEVLPFTRKGYQDLVTLLRELSSWGGSTDTGPCISVFYRKLDLLTFI